MDSGTGDQGMSLTQKFWASVTLEPMQCRTKRDTRPGLSHTGGRGRRDRKKRTDRKIKVRTWNIYFNGFSKLLVTSRWAPNDAFGSLGERSSGSSDWEKCENPGLLRAKTRKESLFGSIGIGRGEREKS